MAIERLIGGGTTSARGFRAGATICGLKESGNLDLAVVYSESDCTTAAVFTQNQVAAAPVLLDRQILAKGRSQIRGVVINAGNANACTGEAGMAAARGMQAEAANRWRVGAGQFMVMSTGVIGVPLQVEKVTDGIRTVRLGAGYDHGQDAAKAIMTTDTYPKHLALQLMLPDGEVIIGGMVKGSGMMHPNMATLLGVLTTDAAIGAEDLQDMLSKAIERSFNRISIDGDTSTNDTITLLANGASGVSLSDPESLSAFAEGLNQICLELAQMIVRDGEGVSKFVKLQVIGAEEELDAHKIAETIATSPLVKTALAGSDPNWGRILAAAGRAGVLFEQERIGLWINNPGKDPLQLVAGGTPTPFQEESAAAIFAEPEIEICLDLGLGQGESVMWTGDLTHEYVTINADYRT